MEAIKDKARGGGKRHACPRRGRSACGVGRSGRIEGEVGRRGVLWQEKSWPRERCAATHATHSPAHPVHAVLGTSTDRAGTCDSMAVRGAAQHCPQGMGVVNFS